MHMVLACMLCKRTSGSVQGRAVGEAGQGKGRTGQGQGRALQSRIKQGVRSNTKKKIAHTLTEVVG